MKINQSTFLYLLIAYLLLLSGCSDVPKNTGYLFIIGGGNRPDYLMEKMISLTDKKDPKVIIIPNASNRPITTAEYQMNQFKELGIKVCNFVYASDSLADKDSIIQHISDADIIFFSGGDQRRLTRDLNGSRLLAAIHKRYSDGAVIAGTSAGAAVMSEIMITGDELISQDSTRAFCTIQNGNIATTPGFRFINKAIIDQHFITRKRQNRLVSIVLEHPDLLGIGIDESTAIIVNPDETFDVIGDNAVIVYDARAANKISINSANQFSAADIKMHILTSGQRFNIVKRRVEK